ncbi:ClpP/crotonase-like domain-containing protein [Naematelia encephala]|uniref:ClpP/crotonase-like domain-containing protein n=1 Tax=Naematelia encephala TaxID=71784 RepID=A0A1Y2B976_9TREE|nr:ClpP/crotonase-like domain-containing protein [Naematelia encephala]
MESTLKPQYHRLTRPREGVLLLELNRSPVNAFHDEMWTELRAIVERISIDPDIRCVVLSSAFDKYFTAGLDLNAQSTLNGSQDLDPARKALVLHQHLLDFQAAISSLASCQQPVIVALHGICFGLAIDLASACDVRLCSSDSVFSIAEVNVGLAADIGTLQRLPKIVGNDSAARELALSGRRFDAQIARDIGFVSRVVQGKRTDVLEAALELAKEIATKSPVAVQSTKHLMNHARDHTIQEGLEYTAAWNMSMLQSVDTSIAMKATLAKKTAIYPPLNGSSRGAKL